MAYDCSMQLSAMNPYSEEINNMVNVTSSGEVVKLNGVNNDSGARKNPVFTNGTIKTDLKDVTITE